MLKKIIAITVLLITSIYIIALYLYPVYEVSGIISDNECLCYKIRRNGTVDFYIGYNAYEIINNEASSLSENGRKSYSKSIRLGLLEKIKVNNIIRNILKNKQESSDIKIIFGTSGIVPTYNCIINGKKYNSVTFVSTDVLDAFKQFNINLAELSIVMWMIKPSEIDELWDYESCEFPQIYLSSENEHVEISESNYKYILRKLRKEFENGKEKWKDFI